jgi:hypothetical protein
MAPATATDADLKGILCAGSNIPANKLDFALSELKQGLDQVRMVLSLQALAFGRQLTVDEASAVIAGAEWIDDDKGIADFNIHAVDEAGDEIASASVRTRLTR